MAHANTHKPGRLVRLMLAVLVLCIALPGLSLGAEKRDLSVVARQAQQQASMDAGLAAAERGDWRAAVEHFGKAQWAHEFPAPPAVYFNIALAVDRQGGRELTAMGYYRMYLAVAPRARNRQAVEARIAELKVIVKDHAMNLMELVEGAAGEFPQGSHERSSALEGVWVAKAFLGDPSFDISAIKGELAPYSPDQAYLKVAEALGHKGDFRGAIKVALMPGYRNALALSQLSALKLEWGDIEGALEIADLIDEVVKYAEEDERATAFSWSSEETILSSAESGRQMALWMKAGCQIQVMRHILLVGNDPGRARAIADGMGALLSKIQDAKYRHGLEADMVDIWMKLAEIDKAVNLARSLPRGDDRASAYRDMAIEFMHFTKIADARRALAELPANETWNRMRSYWGEQIDLMERAMAKLERADTPQGREEAIREMIGRGARHLAPMRSEHVFEGVAVHGLSPIERAIIDLNNFASLNLSQSESVSVMNFQGFMATLREQKLASLMMGFASDGIVELLVKLGEYNRLDAKYPIGLN